MDTDKRQLLTYLKSQNLMTVATNGDYPWAASVYFITDNSFNIYFLSEPTTIHCRNIQKNQNVACSITDSRQKVTDKKIGVQIQGSAHEESTAEKIRWMLGLWNKMNPGFEQVINLHNIQHRVIKSRIYKIIPKQIKFFNEKLYGPEGYKIFTFS
jgi:uncharacterized protein YhbP (UPF0306 family)